MPSNGVRLADNFTAAQHLLTWRGAKARAGERDMRAATRGRRRLDTLAAALRRARQREIPEQPVAGNARDARKMTL